MPFDDTDDLDELDNEEEQDQEEFGPLGRLGTQPLSPRRERAPNPLGAAGQKPSAEEVREHLASLADSFGLPSELVHAVAKTESGFDTGARKASPREEDGRIAGDAFATPVPSSKNYGVMQVSEQHIGKSVKDADGKPFQIGEDIKTDWKANAKAGVALLAEQHELAEMEHPPGSTAEDRAQQAYSGYNAGARTRGRYLETGADGLPADEQDRAFLRNYRAAVVSAGQANVQRVAGDGTEDNERSSKSERATLKADQKRTDAGDATVYAEFMKAAAMPVDSDLVMKVDKVTIRDPHHPAHGPIAEVKLVVADARTLQPINKKFGEIRAVESVLRGLGGPSSSKPDTNTFVDQITAGTTSGGVVAQIFLVDGKRVATVVPTQAGTPDRRTINVLRTTRRGIIYNDFVVPSSRE